MLTPFTSIGHELQSLVKGECFFDNQTREKYSTAASWYKIQPVGVVFPRDVQDVQAVVRYCYEHEIPLIARGAGTGLAGQAIGMGIILDFTQHMNAVVRISDTTVEVEPGIVLQTLNQRLASSGKFFPVDPASGSLCTIGGMIATNAAGAHGLKYHATKDHIESLTVVLSNGEVVTIDAATEHTLSNSTLSNIRNELQTLLFWNKQLINEKFPKVAKNSSGYNLPDSIANDHLDLRKLIVGSEGTLAIVVGASLKLSATPKHRVGALAHFKDYESTVEATVKALDKKPAAIEILDQTYFSLGSGMGPETDNLLRQDAQTMLYFEFEGDLPEILEEQVLQLKQYLDEFQPLDYIPLKTERERTMFWSLREEISKRINLTDAFGKASFIEDCTVPIAQLPAYIRGLRTILSRHDIRYSAYGHAGAGNIHCATFVDLTNPLHYRVIDAIASEVTDLVIMLGGTLSGEHGDGYVRTPFLERLYGTEVYRLFEEIKRIFDPRNILNPGKIVGKQNTTILHDLILT